MSTPEALAAALRERRSIRAFRDEVIPQEHIMELLDMAQQAPSWCNVQPWRIKLTRPPVTGVLAEALQAAATRSLPHPDITFPMDYPEPYRQERRRCGAALYQSMGIARDDKKGRYDAWLRNYALFDAPHLMVLSRDQRLGEYATLDVGVWLGVLLTTAATMGIDTCPMASVAAYPEVLREHLEIPEEEIILFGVALGYRDEGAPANQCKTERQPLSVSLRVLGDE